MNSLICRFVAGIFLLGGCVRAADGWEPFTLDGGHVRFPVTINGIAGTAILDSGAELSGINEFLVERYPDQFQTGGRIRVQGIFGTEEKTMVQNVQVGMFGATLKMSDLTPAQLGDAQLLIGQNFLRAVIIQIDYPNQRLRLLPRTAIDLDKFANIEMKLERNTVLPVVKVAVGDDSFAWLTLDTGNSGGLFVRRQFAEARGWLQAAATEQGLSMGATGAAMTESFVIPYLKFGPFEMEGVTVTIPAEGENTTIGRRDNGRSSRQGKNSDGLLGYDVLKHFVLTLDSRDAKLHIGLPEKTN